MDAAPPFRFTLRTLLALTFIVAAFSLPLAKPWGAWLIALPFMASVLAAYVVTRFILAPLPSRVFWGAFIVGVMIFLLAAMFVGSDIVPDYYSAGQRGVWDERIGAPLWTMMHGNNAFRSNTRGVTINDYRAFKIFLVVDLALLTSATAALLAQIAVNRRLRMLQS